MPKFNLYKQNAWPIILPEKDFISMHESFKYSKSVLHTTSISWARDRPKVTFNGWVLLVVGRSLRS